MITTAWSDVDVGMDTSKVWNQLGSWLGIDGLVPPSNRKEATALAKEAKDSLLRNSCRGLAMAHRQGHNIALNLSRLQRLGGKPQRLVQTFVAELNSRPPSALRRDSRFDDVLSQAKRAVHLSS